MDGNGVSGAWAGRPGGGGAAAAAAGGRATAGA